MVCAVVCREGVSTGAVGKMGVGGLDLALSASIRVCIVVNYSLMALISSIICANIVLSFAGGVC